MTLQEKLRPGSKKLKSLVTIVRAKWDCKRRIEHIDILVVSYYVHTMPFLRKLKILIEAL